MSSKIVGQTISILYADIRGFINFPKLDPETLFEMVNVFWAIAADAIRMRNGVIDKLIGDTTTIVALYNTPLRPEKDHGLRALRSADALRSEYRAHYDAASAGERLFLGVGVHTGEAFFGNVGSPEDPVYTPIGDPINVARRLMEVARADQIVLSQDTYKLVEDQVDVEPLGSMQLKGRSQPFPLYELLKVR